MKPALHRYLLCGALATAIHYAAFGVLLAAGQGAGPAALAAAALGAVTGYAANRRWTFGSGAAHRRAAPRYAAVAGVTMLGHGAGVGLLAPLTGPWAAQLALTAVTTLLGWRFNRDWSFV